MNKKFLISLAILVVFLLSAQNSISIPKKQSEPTFTELTVTTSSSHLLLFGLLENGFTDEMVQGLHSGLPIHFTFYVELNQTAKTGEGTLLASITTDHIISYDTLKETYNVEIEESGKRFFSYEKLPQAQQAANEINGLKVIQLAELQPDTSYTLKLRAELYKKTLPMGLHAVVPFVSWWDVKTKWHSVTFNI